MKKKKIRKVLEVDTIVVGAGLGGLHLARQLQTPGQTLLVLEKSRGLGGRVATRRIEGRKYDHGIPWINKEQLELLPLKGELVQCQSERSKWVSKTGLTSIAKSLAESLNVVQECKVRRLEVSPGGKRWEVIDEESNRYHCGRLILAIPAPQALMLLDQSLPNQLTRLKSKLVQVTYDPQLVLLGEGLGGYDTKKIKSSIVEKIIDNGEKGIEGSAKAYCIYLNESYSKQEFSTDEDAVLTVVTEHLKESFSLQLKNTQLKKWRFANPTEFLKESFLAADILPELFVTGDYFEPGRLEGALLSATALANHLKTLKAPAKKSEVRSYQLRQVGYRRS